MDARQALPGHPRTPQVTEPTLLFYPAGAPHRFLPRAGAAAPLLTCAAVHFEGGPQHPLVAARPPLVFPPVPPFSDWKASPSRWFAESADKRGHGNECGIR